jgi:hypothetical protein
MTDISWTDLNSAEQHAIAVLGAGISPELCNAAAFLALRRAGLVRGSHLTAKAEQLRHDAILEKLQMSVEGSTTISVARKNRTR